MNIFYSLLCVIYFISFIEDKSANGDYYNRPNRGFRNDRYDNNPQAFCISCNVEVKEVDGFTTSMITKLIIIDENLQIFHEVDVRPLRVLNDNFTNITTSGDNDTKAQPFYHVRTKVIQMVRFQILVGHKLNYYLRLLQMHHPVYLRRDTAHFSKFRHMNESKRQSLEQLAKTYLDDDLDGIADNVTANAITGMKLYLKYREEWDKEMQQRPLQPSLEAYALNCETVKGSRDDGVVVDQLAKVTIVDSNGATLYQKMFNQVLPVIDYRTSVTQLYPNNFTNTVTIETERDKIESLLRGHILVGHGLGRDLQLLGIKHPYLLRRDSNTFDRFHRGLAPSQCKTLNDIANHFLDKTIIHGVRGHLDPSRTAMLLYLQYKREWDLEGKKMGERFHDKRFIVPKRKLITPVAVYYDRILVTSKLGQLKVIGRMVIVNGNYQCIYDRFVKPNNMTVLDCFTENTGIHVEDIEQGTSIEEIKEDLVNILRDKILIGYNIKHFLILLGLKFQIFYRRDLRLYNKFTLPNNPKPTITQIAQNFLNVSLTTYTHPVEKARVFMNLYYKNKEDWDIFVAQTYRDLKMMSLNKLIRYQRNSTVVFKPIAMYCNSVTIKNWGLLGYQMLARITLVDEHGELMYDKFVKPYSEIVDYRTNETGIHPEQLLQGEEYFMVLENILQFIQAKIIIGEQLNKCFKLLRHKADWWMLRDIALFSTFKRLNNNYVPLNEICQKYLSFSLQNEKDPIEKARAAMLVYNKFKHVWEIEIKRKHEMLKNKAKMFQQYRNDYSVPPLNKSHRLYRK